MTNLFEVEPISEAEVPVISNLLPKYEPSSNEARTLMTDNSIIELSKTIDCTDLVSLYDLGKEPADKMTEISGKILGQFTVADTIGSTKILDNFTKIAGQIDFKELKAEQPKGLKGFFVKAENVLKTKVAKYQTINGEVNNLFVALKTYENTIKARVGDMTALAEENAAFAKNLDQYIALIYILRNDLDFQIQDMQTKANEGDQDAQIKLPQMIQAASVLDKRAFDLEQSKTMATLTAPQIAQTQENNLNLIQQYHSAFITTIPTLQTGLIQAVTALQQNYAQQGLNASKAAVSDLMKKNAERLAVNNKFIAESSGAPTVSIEDMKSIVNTIVNSVNETKAIEAATAKKRDESRVEMENIIRDSRKLMTEEVK